MKTQRSKGRFGIDRSELIGKYRTARKQTGLKPPPIKVAKRVKRLIRELLYDPWKLELLTSTLSSLDDDIPRGWLRVHLGWTLVAKDVESFGFMTRFFVRRALTKALRTYRLQLLDETFPQQRPEEDNREQ
jgi:hypothetical protein